MILADLRDNDRVFIDANIFIYHFGGRSLECKAFLERCARRELLGYTSTPVLAEMLHRRPHRPVSRLTLKLSRANGVSVGWSAKLGS